MPEGGGPDAGRPRPPGALLRDALAVLLARPGTFLLIGAAFAVPVGLAVVGLGLERLSGGYDRDLELGEAVLEVLVGALLVTPLVTAAAIHAMRAGPDGTPVGAGEAIMRALDAFAPLFAAVCLAAAGVALGLLLVIPGVYLFFRWFFVPQVVVLEGRRDVNALRASGEVVEGHWWRTIGVILLANLVAAVPGLLASLPFEAIADSVDSDAVSLAGSLLADAVTTPFLAVVGTLLYFDLKARRAAEF